MLGGFERVDYSPGPQRSLDMYREGNTVDVVISGTILAKAGTDALLIRTIEHYPHIDNIVLRNSFASSTQRTMEERDQPFQEGAYPIQEMTTPGHRFFARSLHMIHSVNAVTDEYATLAVGIIDGKTIGCAFDSRVGSKFQRPLFDTDAFEEVSDRFPSPTDMYEIVSNGDQAGLTVMEPLNLVDAPVRFPVIAGSSLLVSGKAELEFAALGVWLKDKLVQQAPRDPSIPLGLGVDIFDRIAA